MDHRTLPSCPQVDDIRQIVCDSGLWAKAEYYLGVKMNETEAGRVTFNGLGSLEVLLRSVHHWRDLDCTRCERISQFPAVPILSAAHQRSECYFNFSRNS